MLRAPARISQRWASARGSLPRRDWLPPDWLLFLGWPPLLGLLLLLGWPLLLGWLLPPGWPSSRDSDT
jgi:hypothetical protein